MSKRQRETRKKSHFQGDTQKGKTKGGRDEEKDRRRITGMNQSVKRFELMIELIKVND